MKNKNLFGALFVVIGGILFVLHIWSSSSFSLNGLFFLLTGLVYLYQERLIKTCLENRWFQALIWFFLALCWIFYIVYDTGTITVDWLKEQEVFLSLLVFNVTLIQFDEKVRKKQKEMMKNETEAI